jgi:hypothetical protein
LDVTVTSRQDPGEPSVEDLTEPRVAAVTGASSGIGLAAAERPSCDRDQAVIAIKV